MRATIPRILLSDIGSWQTEHWAALDKEDDSLNVIPTDSSSKFRDSVVKELTNKRNYEQHRYEILRFDCEGSGSLCLLFAIVLMSSPLAYFVKDWKVRSGWRML